MKETEFEKYFQRPCQYCGECPIWAAAEGDPSQECKQAVRNGTCTCFGRYVNFDELGNNDIMKKKYITLLTKHYLLNETVKFVPEIHAYWKHIRDEQAFYNCEIWDYFRCSHCNFESTANWNYCPKCGAKMDGKK